MLVLLLAVVGFCGANSASVRGSLSLQTLDSPNCDTPFASGLKLFCCKNNLVPSEFEPYLCNGNGPKDANIIHMDIVQNKDESGIDYVFRLCQQQRQHVDANPQALPTTTGEIIIKDHTTMTGYLWWKKASKMPFYLMVDTEKKPSKTDKICVNAEIMLL